jgi:pimeloyl-ACP methyl ester carboxylesterase
MSTPTEFLLTHRSIVVVHGLNPTSNLNHAWKTWTIEYGVCWLTHQDLLPKLLPRARILLYSYNSKLVCMDHRFLGQSRDLLERLLSSRLEDPQRPLLFIAHSLGGLVLKAVSVLCLPFSSFSLPFFFFKYALN